METASISIQATREATAPQQGSKRRIARAQWIAELNGLPQLPQYLPLELVTKPNLTTRELAYYSNMAEQTWREKACYDTAPEGLRPLRVCGRLAWPTAGARKLLGVGVMIATHRMTDIERERQIEDLGQKAEAAYAHYERTGALADHGKAHAFRLEMQRAIAQRSPAQVALMETARGLK
ncbi:hypothetical protein [Polaromonas sp.]|uniref:hypothetical protein n=1 Tax=Polaromonas sp. TaxID=1869339 RepID=UPI0025E446E9|nr:hypothetical protein [Polaromonas sp.]